MNQETKKSVADLKKTDPVLAKHAEEYVEEYSKRLVESGKFGKEDNLLRILEKRSLESYVAGYNEATAEYEDKLSCILD